MATAPSANDLTRQQLDELDALLQRMLSLPLNPAESAPVSATAATNWRTDPPTAVLSSPPHLTAPPLPVELPRNRIAEPEATPVRQSWPTPPVVTVPPVPPPEPAQPVVERKVAPSSAPSHFAFEPLPDVKAATASRTAHAPSVPFFLWPFVGLNWTFDAMLGVFGPPGWLFRSAFGKNLLGVGGLALLLYTAVHVSSQQGWVELPFPLPWPR